MPNYKVIIFYNENKPRLAEKKFEVTYEIVAENSDTALKLAVKKFMYYENNSYASWIRTIIGSETIVIPELNGKFLDEYQTSEILAFLNTNDNNVLNIVIEGIRWNSKFKQNKPIVLKLMELMENSQSIVRINAVETLRNIEGKHILDKFFKMLSEDISPHERATIISVIGKRKITDMKPIVIKHINDKDTRVRANAVDTLGEIGNKDDIQYIFPLLDDGNNRVVANAVTSIWKLGKFYKTEKIVEMFSDKNELMRASAAYALGEIEDSEVYKLIENNLFDESSIVRKNLIKSLKKHRDIKSLNLLVKCFSENDSDVKDCIIDAVISFGSASEKLLYDSLKDEKSRELAEEILDIIKKIKLKEGKFFEWMFMILKTSFINKK